MRRAAERAPHRTNTSQPPSNSRAPPPLNFELNGNHLALSLLLLPRHLLFTLFLAT
jgi:hypothetical protein